eukprot:CAMPEP_0119277486 /NCGR_PEP_ID=MMETSP1329-20130426/17227_1 /TAXON_ID=114041 /ORGANISM="Genus nov. species nov., Strain RCC1024" /LENGTH=227 /DNA_ID=CAMNT_0007277955 /DNA_START=53 /DNA_END=732 /DNA_ORIENTATION=-
MAPVRALRLLLLRCAVDAVALTLKRRQAIGGFIGSAFALVQPQAAGAATATSAARPAVAARLLELCQNRRPADWSPAEREEMDRLVDEVSALRAPWPRDALQGKWKLVYLRPGPDGAGVDRRIPFPELDFNDSFQIFGEKSVTNIGEVLGPAVRVEVSGGLEEADSTTRSPKRFVANIDAGALCVSQTCVPLPISGEGLFDGLYLDDGLRIGQNLNGGGARVVQVKV